LSNIAIYLKEHGMHRIKKEYITKQFDDMAEHYIQAYLWFVGVASKKVPKPLDVTFPIWCSISEKNMLRPIENTVVYVLEIEDFNIFSVQANIWEIREDMIKNIIYYEGYQN
jgi:hypothetical protein